MASILHLFLDTNILLHCQHLETLPWGDYKDCDTIELILTTPVQEEIDSLKQQPNSKRADKARGLSAVIRDLLLSEDNSKVVRSSRPVVRLTLKDELRTNLLDEQALDFKKRDDQLVGIAVAFARSNPQFDVRLLTNDTGPMATAKRMKLSYEVPPKSWLLKPEPDEKDKRIAALERQVQDLAKREPTFEFTVHTTGGLFHCEPSSKKLKAALNNYSRLTQAEIDGYIARLKQRFPLATSFEQRPPPEKSPSKLSAADQLAQQLLRRYVPASDAEINNYSREYAEWTNDSRRRLEKLHVGLNMARSMPTLRIGIMNTGSRPALDSLIVIKATGDIRLLSPLDDEEAQLLSLASLQSPPQAPRGTMYDLCEGPNGLFGTGAPKLYDAIRPYPGPTVRDPDRFYKRPSTTKAPRSELEFECANWRHRRGTEIFEFRIVATSTAVDARGAIHIEVHASNLAEVATKHFPVELSFTPTTSNDEAAKLVAALS